MWRFLKTVGIILFAIYLLYGCGGGGGSSSDSNPAVAPPPIDNPKPPDPQPPPDPPKPNVDIYKESIQTTFSECYWTFKPINDEYKCMMQRTVLLKDESLIVTLTGRNPEKDIATITTTIYNPDKTIFTGPLLDSTANYDYEITYYEHQEDNVEMQIFIDGSLIPDGNSTIQFDIRHVSDTEDISTIELVKDEATEAPNLTAPYIEGKYAVQCDPILITDPGYVSFSLMMFDLDSNLDIWSTTPIAEVTIQALNPEVNKTDKLTFLIVGNRFDYGTMSAAQYKIKLQILNFSFGYWYVSKLVITDLGGKSRTYFSFYPDMCFVVQ